MNGSDNVDLNVNVDIVINVNINAIVHIHVTLRCVMLGYVKLCHMTFDVMLCYDLLCYVL